MSKAAIVASNRILTQTDTAGCGTLCAGTSFAAVSGLNLRIESALNNNSLFSEVVNARGPAYSSFNSVKCQSSLFKLFRAFSKLET